MKTITRFVIFGVHVEDKDTLIENHTNEVPEAILLADVMSSADYSARIWDNKRNKFLSKRMIDRLLKTM
jgi:hypothetical protein